MRKNLDPNLRPEKQHTFPKQRGLERLCVGQGRARSKKKGPDPINHAINQPSNLSQEIPGRMKIETRKTNCVHSTDPTHSINSTDDMIPNNNSLMPDAAFHPGPILRPPPKPIKQMSKVHKIQNILIQILILILRKTHHFKKASCPRHSEDWTNHFFRNLNNWVTL